jgi:hypothetical protein
MENKRLYLRPEIEVCILHTNESVMLQASLDDEEADFVGGKEQGEFVEEDVVPTSPNIWGDTEEED